MKIDISSICEKIFYINMKKSITRDNKTVLNLEKLNLPFERVNAITPDSYFEYSGGSMVSKIIENNKTPKIWNIHSKRSPRWEGDFCCAISHYKAITTAINQGLKKVMICEDDFVYLQDESFLFQENIKKIPNDFDVIHITSLIHGNYNNAFRNNKFIDYKLKGEFINEFVFRVTYGLLGTGAYIINLENKEWVNEFLNAMLLGTISDCFMAFHMQGKYKHYTTKYKLGYQDYLEQTTIASKKGSLVDPNSSRIKWLKQVTFNTPWSILEQKNKNMVARILSNLDNTPII